MTLEHVAFNVHDPEAVAAWYTDHLGMRVVRRVGNAARALFLADTTGHGVIEIYNNPPDAVPEYAAMNPLQFHLAFISLDPVADRQRLLTAGATFIEAVTPPNGSLLIMMRDPWGIPLQLCHRATSLC